MGIFFTNIQVLANDLSSEELRKGLICCITEQMPSLGFKLVNEGDKGDRTIFIGPVTKHPWITVFDSATESQDIDLLDKMASMLSSAMNKIVISILVHDSDLLQMKLYQNGLKLDELDSWPGYFSGKDKPFKNSDSNPRTEFERWIELFNNEFSILDLQKAWRCTNHSDNAISLLEKMAKVLGLDITMCCLGANMITDPVLIGCEKLQFISSTEQYENDYLASMLPVFNYQGGIESKTEILLEESLVLKAITHNTGGSSKGLRVVVWGKALDYELVDIESLSLNFGLPEKIHPIYVQLETVLCESGTTLSATLNHLVIPAGIDSPASAFKRAGMDYDEGIKVWLATRITLNIEIRAIKPGVAELHVGLVPLSNPDEGQISWSSKIFVKPASIESKRPD